MLRTERHFDTFRRLKQNPADWDLGRAGPEVIPRSGSDCQLCGRHGLKNFYPLNNGNVTMYAGSECIKTWVETIYKVEYNVAFQKIMRDSFNEWKTTFFTEYHYKDYKPKPERNLSQRVYETKYGVSDTKIKQIYSLARKFGYTLPEKVKNLWDIQKP